mmetsp:Transcript_4309/g.13161  ORF Transcript_4309/g.13161 Transcript_4309/m.13161 type:complete len:208 (-) Transcript_4309:8-631(-)
MLACSLLKESRSFTYFSSLWSISVELKVSTPPQFSHFGMAALRLSIFAFAAARPLADCSAAEVRLATSLLCLSANASNLLSRLSRRWVSFEPRSSRRSSCPRWSAARARSSASHRLPSELVSFLRARVSSSRSSRTPRSEAAGMRYVGVWKGSGSFPGDLLLSDHGVLRKAESSSSELLARQDIGEGEPPVDLVSLTVGGLQGQGRS